MMATEPTTTPPAAATPQPVDPALAQARWRLLRNGVVGATIGAAAVLAAVMFLVARPDWWRGYAAATVATVLAAAASLVPLWAGVRGPAGQLVSMFMASTATRGFVAVGLSVLAIAVGKYPTVPTLALLLPYYVTLLAVETACLTRGLKLR